MTSLPISLARSWDTNKNHDVLRVFTSMAEELDFDVVPNIMSWSTLWDDIQQIAQNKSSMVISEVGSTWLANLVEQDVLYDFTEEDIARLGGFHAFSKWNVGVNTARRGVYAIPWLMDSQVMYYWRDMIDDAGVDPTFEFASVNGFEHALEKISQKVIRFPWAVSTLPNPASLHQMASWIWGSDAGIINEKGSHLQILDIKAIQAITRYFSLYRYIPEYSQTSPTKMTEYFANRQAALMMGGTHTYYDFKRLLPPHQMNRIGVALPPGVPFVGTQVLVMWKHGSDDTREHALRFLESFLSADIHQQMSEINGLMSTNTDLLNQPMYQQNEMLWTINTAIQIGRSYPALPNWADIELNLINTMGAIWEDILMGKATDIENVVFKHLIRFGQTVRPMLS